MVVKTERVGGIIKSSTYAIISELSKLRVQLRRTSAKPRNTCSWRLTFPVVKERFNYLCLSVSFCFHSAHFDCPSLLFSHSIFTYLTPALFNFLVLPFFLVRFLSFLPFIFLNYFFISYFRPFFLSTFPFKPHVLSSFIQKSLFHLEDEIFSISRLPFDVETNCFCEMKSIADYILFLDLHWSASIIRDGRIKSTFLVWLFI